jgi:hypothetical protein
MAVHAEKRSVRHNPVIAIPDKCIVFLHGRESPCRMPVIFIGLLSGQVMLMREVSLFSSQVICIKCSGIAPYPQGKRQHPLPEEEESATGCREVKTVVIASKSRPVKGS